MTLPYQPHSETSREAAEAAAPTAKCVRERVLEAIRAAGADGLTDEELDVVTGCYPTARPRRVELRDAGLVRDSGFTRRSVRGWGAG
jgi:hypothetical protein